MTARMSSPKRKAKPIADREFAAIKFKAWAPVGPQNQPIPSSRMMDQVTISSRLAYALMLKSKAELVAMHSGMDPEIHNEMLTGLQETAERLKEMASLVDQAIHRLCVSGTAYTLS